MTADRRTGVHAAIAIAVVLALIAGAAAVWHGRVRLRDADAAQRQASDLSKQLRDAERVIRPGDRSAGAPP